jgi:PAS domain S-box-containing protein
MDNVPPHDSPDALSDAAEKLHQRAEAAFLRKFAMEPELSMPMTPEEMQRMFHELQVHQIELEMQNEELRRSQAEVEAARARYFDLYDLAPVGYITLDEQGIIRESNYAAAGLLGVSRRGLVKQPITRFIVSEEQDHYYLQCRRLLETGLPQVTELRMTGRDSKEFWARLEAAVVRSDLGEVEFRLILTNITERKSAAEELKRSEAFQRDILNSLPAHIAVLDKKGKILAVNEPWLQFARANGNPLLEKIGPGVDYFEVCHTACGDGDTYANAAAAGIKSVLAGTQIRFSLEYPCDAPDCARWFAMEVLQPLGSAVGAIVAHTDITERKKAEEALAHEQKLLRTLVELLPTVVFVKDRESRFMLANVACAKCMGAASPDELIGKTDADFYPPEAAAGMRNDELAVLEGKPLVNQEVNREPPGQLRQVLLINKVPLRDSDGEIIGLVGAGFDITARKQAEEALRDANQKLRLHFEQTPMGVIEWDTNFRVTRWNPAATTIFGYSREEALGRHATFIVPKAYHSMVDGIMRALLEKAGGERATNANVSKDGTPILCEWYNTPLIDEHGTVAGIASVVMDITERTEAQEMLAWEKSALELIGSVSPLREVLDRLMLSLEKQIPGALCSVLLLDEDGVHLRHGAAPSLPDAYNRAVDGVPIGPAAGSCGTAAYLKRQVIVEDIATDPLWADYREVALKHDLHACWSTPVHDSGGKILGTFAIYYREPRHPAVAELEMVERAVHVVRITIKRKLAEEALQESEKKFRALFENAGDAILISEGDRFIDCNARTLDLFHCHSRDQIVGHSIHELSSMVQPDGRPSSESAVEKIAAALAGQPQFFEWTHRSLDGTTFPADVSLNPVELGGKLLVQAIVRDISERKQAEEEIRNLNVGLENRVADRTRELQEANASLTDFKAALDEHALVSITDSDGIITYANAKFCEISQYPQEDLIGQDHRIVNSGHHPEAFFQDLWQTVMKGSVWKGEMKNRAKDGSFYWVDTTIVPFLGRSGKPAQFMAIRTDITKRKLAEDALRVSGERLRLATEVASIGVWERDIKSQTLNWDRRMFEIYGLPENPEGQASYQDWRARVLPEDLAAQESRLEHTIVTCGRDQREFRIVRASDHAVRVIQAAEMVVVGTDGQALRMVGINLDITERKRSEDEISKLNADLQNRAAELLVANQELEAFSYSVSHDLRAPLRAVDGFSRMVLEDYADKLDEDGRRKLGVIRSESQRMGRLIDDLLAFSRLGRQPIEPVGIDMRGLAQGVFDELAARDPTRNLLLDLQPLPPACGSEALVRQVWVNLISNAIKFTKERDPGMIEIGSKTDVNGELIYYVKDNGAGFDMRHAGKLFGVFQRLHTQEEFTGTGVGLALVQRIVHRHGGRIWAESEVGRGAAFYFTLPNQNS